MKEATGEGKFRVLLGGEGGGLRIRSISCDCVVTSQLTGCVMIIAYQKCANI